MRVVEAAGTAYEIGRSIGKQVPDLVHAAVAVVCRFDVPRPEVDRRFRTIEQRLRTTFPYALEEASGLAAGAGISERDALALSVASDVHGRLPGWCSLIAVRSETGTLVGKNLDTTIEMGDLQLVGDLSPEGRHPYRHVTTAGAMWTDGGVNQAGLALVNSSLAASRAAPDGVPDGILAREVLASCGSVPEAIELLSQYEPLSLGENLLLADRDGQVALVEKLPGGQAVYEAPGAVVACNHVRAKALGNLIDTADPIRENSRTRYAQLTALSRERRTWSLDQVQHVLASHEGGICQHGQANLWTVASLVVSPREQRMWINEGPPCDAAWVEVQAGIGGVPAPAHTTQEEERHGTQ